MGMGAASCTQFSQHYRSGSDTMENFFFNWAQGYMSGLNYVLLEPKVKSGNPLLVYPRDLRAIPIGEQKQLIRTYCDKSPDKLYLDAVLSLYLRLPTGTAKRD